MTKLKQYLKSKSKLIKLRKSKLMTKYNNKVLKMNKNKNK